MEGQGLPRWLSGKESACQIRIRRSRFDPWVGISPRGGNGNLLEYSCLENPLDIGGWCAAVHGAPKSQTRLSNWAHTRMEGQLWKLAKTQNGIQNSLRQMITYPDVSTLHKQIPESGRFNNKTSSFKRSFHQWPLEGGWLNKLGTFIQWYTKQLF